jgi:hypothetical protein
MTSVRRWIEAVSSIEAEPRRPADAESRLHQIKPDIAAELGRRQAPGNGVGSRHRCSIAQLRFKAKSGLNRAAGGA